MKVHDGSVAKLRLNKFRSFLLHALGIENGGLSRLCDVQVWQLQVFNLLLLLNWLEFVLKFDWFHRGVLLFYNVLDTLILITLFCKLVLQLLKTFLAESLGLNRHKRRGSLLHRWSLREFSSVDNLLLGISNNLSTALVLSFFFTSV